MRFSMPRKRERGPPVSVLSANIEHGWGLISKNPWVDLLGRKCQPQKRA